MILRTIRLSMQSPKSMPQTIHVPPVSGDIQLLLRQQPEAIMALTLPQPEVPVFSGNPVEYCDFIRAFKNLIETKTSSLRAKLYYLLQYTSGQVQDMVGSCLAMQEDRGKKATGREVWSVIQNCYSVRRPRYQWPANPR